MEEVARPTLAQIFGRFYGRYRKAHGVSREQRQAAWCIQACRTPALGGEELWCDRCGQTHRVYHSCRNRSCPVCQAAKSREWLQAQQERLLPVPYFHVVFSIASELRVIFQYNRRLLYGLLFQVSAETLQRFAGDPRWLGARIGFLGVLHTWGQQMPFHPHIHYIVPQGGIDEQGRWVGAKAGWKGKFLFPMTALSQVFRARLLSKLEQLYRSKKLKFPDPQSESRFEDTLRIAASKKWEVYAKRPFAGPEAILKYLGLYTHRVAISSGRLLSMDEKEVEIEYKDYREGARRKSMKLRGEEFVGRFLQHVPPRGLRRIRHYGYLSARWGQQAIEGLQAQWLSRLGAMLSVLCQWVEKVEQPAEVWVRKCPVCGEGILRTVRNLAPVPMDSS